MTTTEKKMEETVYSPSQVFNEPTYPVPHREDIDTQSIWSTLANAGEGDECPQLVRTSRAFVSPFSYEKPGDYICRSGTSNDQATDPLCKDCGRVLVCSSYYCALVKRGLSK